MTAAWQAAAGVRLLGPCAPSFDWVKETYRQRFAIETTDRQLHRARIRTTTRDPVRRLLYVEIALILRNVWMWLHRTVLARPRRGGREIRLDLLRSRRMLLLNHPHLMATCSVT